FLVQGYPAERVLRDGVPTRGLQAMGFVTLAAGRRPGDLSVLYPPPVQAALTVAPTSTASATAAPAEAPHPHGISGGGIWSYPRAGAAAVNGWRRSVRLVGIARG